MPTSGIRPIGRATQGVRLIEIEAEDAVVSVARLAEQEQDDESNQEPGQEPDSGGVPAQ
jgi:DNA gyrase subunit A